MNSKDNLLLWSNRTQFCFYFTGVIVERMVSWFIYATRLHQLKILTERLSILNSPSNLVFFFCDVLVCLNNANGSICKSRCDNCTMPGAGGGNGRKRRSLGENGFDSGSNTSLSLLVPFQQKNKTKEKVFT